MAVKKYRNEQKNEDKIVTRKGKLGKKDQLERKDQHGKKDQIGRKDQPGGKDQFARNDQLGRKAQDQIGKKDQDKKNCKKTCLKVKFNWKKK